MDCTVKSKKADRQITVDFNFGSDLSEAVDMNGEVAVFNHYAASAKLSINSLIRPMLEAVDEEGNPVYDAAQIEAAVAAYKLPDKTGRTVDKGAKALELLQGMSAEKRAEILALLAE